MPVKRQHFQNADVLYDWGNNSKGEKLRTFVTRPRKASGKVPVIFFVGWLSCDSMEYPGGETDGFGALILRLIDQSGYATVRMDKPGVGESQGSCGKADFNSELEGWRAAFDSMAKYDFVDANRVFVLGMSNGGVLTRGGKAIRALHRRKPWGALNGTWLARAPSTQLVEAAGWSTTVRAFTQFYDLYLNRGMTPDR